MRNTKEALPPPGLCGNVIALHIRGDIFGTVWAAHFCICALKNNSSRPFFDTKSDTCRWKCSVRRIQVSTTIPRLTVLGSVNPGSKWKGRRGVTSEVAWVLPKFGRASGGRMLLQVLPIGDSTAGGKQVDKHMGEMTQQGWAVCTEKQKYDETKRKRPTHLKHFYSERQVLW